MGTENTNPFSIPGFGPAGDAASNPVMASMDMMRRAWQGMAGASGMEAAAMATPMSPEDLERRITELRAVENWLRLNLSMLSSTIQGLEVQRATISTLMSFAANASGGFTAPAGSSPARGQTAQETPAAMSPEAVSQATAAAQEGVQQATQAAAAYAASSESAVKGWWDMLQKQFDTLAAATASSMQKTEDADGAAPVSGDTSSSKAPSRSPSKSAAKSPRAAAKPAAATKTARKRAPAKKA